MSTYFPPAMSMMELGGEPLYDGGQVGVVGVRLGHVYPVGEVCYLVVVMIVMMVAVAVAMVAIQSNSKLVMILLWGS